MDQLGMMQKVTTPISSTCLLSLCAVAAEHQCRLQTEHAKIITNGLQLKGMYLKKFVSI